MFPHLPVIVAIYPRNIPVIDQEFDKFDFSKDFKSTLSEMETDTFYHNAFNLKE